MYTQEVTINNEVGLHARPATYFIRKANEFKSGIWVEKDERRVNAKSLLGVLSLGIVKGTTITLIADGSAVKVVAVVDKNAAQFKSNMRINLGSVDATLDKSVHTYTDIDELIRAEEFDVADICLPSFLHKDAAVKLMRAGKHVIADATFLNQRSREWFIMNLGVEPREIHAIVVNTPFEVCMERNAAREGITRVPDSSMYAMKHKFQIPNIGVEKYINRVYMVK